MSLCFFEHGARRIEEIIKPGVLCAFDFDGTLAPIVKDPERACMPAAISRRLAILSEYARVAIITGRSLEDIGLRLDFLPEFVIGNHGIEGIPGWEERAGHYRKLCGEWAQRLSAALNDRALFDAGIWIENKAYSLSVHYRMARNREDTEQSLGKLFAALVPDAHVIGGKCVFNLMPPGSVNKGIALERLLDVSGASGALYVGDDVTDEDVFRLHRKDVLTVRIERAVDSAAEFHLNHRLEMVQLFDELIGRLSEAHTVAAGR